MVKRFKNYSIVSLMVLVMFVVLVALAWSTISSDAFATDEEMFSESFATTDSIYADTDFEVSTSEECIPNNANADIPKITFKINPYSEALKQTVKTESYPYTDENPTPITCHVENAVLSLYTYTVKQIIFNTTVDVNWAGSLGYTFYGFFINNQQITNETTIPTDSEIEVRFLKPDRFLKITTISAEDKSTPIGDYNIDLFDKDQNLINTFKTNAQGKFDLKIDKSYYDGYVIAWKDGMTESTFGIVQSMFSDADYELKLYEASLDDANYNIVSDNPNHQYFKMHVKDNESLYNLEYTSYFESLRQLITDEYGASFTMNQDGSLKQTNNNSNSVANATITAVSKDDAAIDHWIIKYDDEGTFKEIYPGQSVEVDFSTDKISLDYAYAKENTETFLTSSAAQTGDLCNFAIPVALFALSFTIFLVVCLRRSTVL